MIGLNGTPTLDGFAVPAGAATSGPISLPVDRVDVRDLAVELETPLGATKLKGHGSVTGIDGGIHLAGAIDLAGNAAQPDIAGGVRPVALADIATRQDISLSYL